MKALMVSSFIVLLVFSCQSVETKDNVSSKEEISIKDEQLRHGWTIFTGPKPATLDVRDQDSIARGEKLYIANCVSCHGNYGEGDGVMAMEMGIRATDLKALSNLHPSYYLVFQINEGTGDMPSWKDLLTPKQSRDLGNYIQSLYKN